jgi:predicted site-specific integrase-resolvase
MEQNKQDALMLLDSAEARAMLRVSRSTLERLVRQGKIKRSAVSVRRALFPLSEIHRLIATPLDTRAA